MKNKILKMILLAFFITLGVVISPLLRVEGMCPMAHFINIVCSVFLGPWYSLICATMIGIIRMLTMGIPPIALTGAIFGAFLSGVCYRLAKGKLFAAVGGEIIGTGLIGAIVSYPVMTFLWGKEGLSWLFYIPSFTCGTLIGGAIAFLFLKKLTANGMLTKLQRSLGTKAYNEQHSAVSNALAVAALGGVSFVVCSILSDLLLPEAPFWPFLIYGTPVIAVVLALIYYIVHRKEKTP